MEQRRGPGYHRDHQRGRSLHELVGGNTTRSHAFCWGGRGGCSNASILTLSPKGHHDVRKSTGHSDKPQRGDLGPDLQSLLYGLVHLGLGHVRAVVLNPRGHKTWIFSHQRRWSQHSVGIHSPVGQAAFLPFKAASKYRESADVPIWDATPRLPHHLHCRRVKLPGDL